MWGVSFRGETVLQPNVLYHAQSEGSGVHRGMVFPETQNKATRSRGLRLLREAEATYSGASYRPQRQKQCTGEFDNAVRTLPQPLSSQRCGTCADDLAPLLSGEGYRVVDIQTDTHNFYCEGVLAHNCLIIDDPHALEISTPIATPKGFVALGDLQIGDEVFGPDGEPTRVVAKSEVYIDRPLYAVTTYDGETVYADAKHLWNVRTSTRVKDPYRNLTTEELVEARSSAFMLPRHSAVQYPWRDLPIDPWVLGAWLGDGTSSLGRMTAHPDDAVFMRAEFKRRGYETTDLTDKYNFGVTGLWTQLKALGVLNAKHIPEVYMTASFLQRMDLLCGLIDTDGNVTKQGQCTFHNKDAKLVDQVVELLHSLGRKCQRRTYLSKGNFGTCIMHRVTFKLKDCALMPRKRMRTRTTHDKQHRSITVRKTDQRGTVQCITVERGDGLFLAGRGYVVTHNSEQEAALAEINPDIYDKTYEWYTSGPRQRLQPGGAIIIIATRWSKRDLVGQVLKAEAQRGGEGWEVIEFPAILPSGNPLWPEFWSLKELEALREELPNSKWMAQYQQQPTSETSAIVKREWWKLWETDTPPPCDFILMSWDTAFEKGQRADYSALTTWGVFHKPDDTGVMQTNIILLNAFRERMEFPRLKQVALEQYKEWKPDSVIIEKKASGAPLIYELRAMGIPVQEFTPTKGNDKISRLNAVADLFASGRVWAPNTHWAEEVTEEVASFPSGEHDDFCLVAGSKVLMADGTHKGVEDVVVGEFVATPIGPRRVTASGHTGVKPTITVTLISGESISLTDNHPLATLTGWKKAGDVNLDDTIITVSTLPEKTSWGLNLQRLMLRRWFLTGTHTTDTRTPLAGLIGCISLGLGRSYIGKFGSFIMERFQKGIISTIKTGIQGIIGSRIWSVCLVNSTMHIMPRIDECGGGPLNSWGTSKESGLYPRAGIAPRKGWSGIGTMLKTLSLKRICGLGGVLGPWWRKSALCVGGVSLSETRGVPSALNHATIENAGRRYGLRSWGPLKYAKGVGRSLLRCIEVKNTARQNANVKSTGRNTKPVAVYNLTVEEAHCYYAEGVLVHNCDSLSLALGRFRRGGFVTTDLDELDEPKMFRSFKHRGYY